MTPAQASKLVAVLIASFPHARVTEATSSAYETMPADLDSSSASAAVKRLIASAKFLPTIAEIREATIQVTDGDRRHGGEAWGDVLRAVSRFGAYQTPEFSDTVVARCVVALGWRELCSSENQVSDRARFVELYDKLAGEARKEQVIGALPGASRRELERSGEPTLVAKLLREVTR